MHWRNEGCDSICSIIGIVTLIEGRLQELESRTGVQFMMDFFLVDKFRGIVRKFPIEMKIFVLN